MGLGCGQVRRRKGRAILVVVESPLISFYYLLLGLCENHVRRQQVPDEIRYPSCDMVPTDVAILQFVLQQLKEKLSSFDRWIFLLRKYKKKNLPCIYRGALKRK